MAVGMLFFGVIIDWGSYPTRIPLCCCLYGHFRNRGVFILRKVKPLRESRTRPNKLQLPLFFLLLHTMFCLKRTLFRRCG